MHKKTSKGLPYKQIVLRIPESMGDHLEAFRATVNIKHKTTVSEKDIVVLALAKFLGVEYMLDEYYRLKGSRANKAPNFVRKVVANRTTKIEEMMKPKNSDTEKLANSK